MERSDIEAYLKRLQKLDQELTDDTNEDELMLELNNIVEGLSKGIQLDVTKKVAFATLKFINKSTNPDPEFVKEGDSGFDLRANLTEDISIPSQRVRVIPTGLFFEVDKGLEVQVRPRSGLVAKHHVMVLNTPGTIDSGYRGEIQIILINLGESSFNIRHGDRIAQGVVCPVYGEGKLNMVKVNELSESSRNSGGFGHTGIS